MRMTKVQARNLMELLEASKALAAAPLSLINALQIQLDRAQAAHIEAGDDNTVLIEVVP